MSFGFFEKRKYPPVGFGPDLGDDDQDVGPPETSANTLLEHYVHVGDKLIEWAQNRKLWPTTVRELMDQLNAYHRLYNNGIDEKDVCIVFSAKYKRFTIVQAGDGNGGKPVLDENNNKEFLQHADSEILQLKGDDGSNGPEFVIRLPPCGQVTESEDRVLYGDGYVLPPLYNGILFPTTPISIDRIKVFKARVADYTMRSCR